MEVKRGEIYMVDLKGKGNIQRGIRPAVVIQNNTGNRFSPTLQIAPLTRNVDKKEMPTHVKVSYEWLDSDSIILVEQARVINKSELQQRLGSINQLDTIKLNEAIMISYGLNVG
ncbi:MAG: type II toxin-antitoxin system PemK/MazF family toxin [Acutalibacteraceae bacterium]|nr:type II toxin-antitoxin system PemK/MazF family toxin [Acutalibacteraceae bacterium]